jgi:GNAT superfamily N-acetyltransferase
MTEAIPSAVRQLWCTLAGDEGALLPGTTTVVRGSRGLCPPGWTGVVRLGDAWLIEAGDADDRAIDVLRSLGDPSEPAQVVDALRPARTLGPGELAYLPVDGEVVDLDRGHPVRAVPGPSLRSWLDTLPEGDVGESSVEDMDEALVLHRGEQLLGAAGHLVWPADIGHVGLLVAPEERGRGVGSCLAAAATRRVLDRGLSPQWRAATWNAASRRVAANVGYREMGRQFSFLPGERASG